MKIDLYNNTETFINESRQDSAIGQWCRSLGLDRIKIENHPYVKDIRILIDLRNYSTWFNARDKKAFDLVWRQVYEYEYPLSVFHKRKLLQVVASVEYQQKHMKKKVIMMSKKGLPLTETKLTDFSV